MKDVLMDDEASEFFVLVMEDSDMKDWLLKGKFKYFM